MLHLVKVKDLVVGDMVLPYDEGADAFVQVPHIVNCIDYRYCYALDVVSDVGYRMKKIHKALLIKTERK